MSRSLLMLACACAGCGKGTSTADCRTQVDELMTLLRATDHTASIRIDDDMHLPSRPELAAREQHDGPVVELRTSGTRYKGEPLAGLALGRQLAADMTKIKDNLANGRTTQRTDPRLAYLLADAATPWRDVAGTLVVMAEAGFDHPALVFAGKPQIAAPPRTWADDQVDKIKGKPEAATALAGMVADIAKPCPALGKAYGVVSGDGGDKVAYIIDATGEALIECRCAIDVPALRSVLWRVIANPHPTTLLALELARDGVRIELAATTPWRDAAAKLSPGARIWPVAK